jgi:hypothetical protein
MTRFVGTPLRGIEFANAGDEAVSARVGTDAYPRIRIDAGGRITWASGSVNGDTNLYRDSANTLKTDDVFHALSGVITLSSSGVPTDALPNGALAVDTTNHQFYFRSNNTWNLVEDGGGATVIAQSSAPVGQDEGTLWLDTDTFVLSIYYNSQWVQVSSGSTLDLDGGNELNDIFEAEITNGIIAIYDGAGV